jgi:YspA, cpYpsA-related SLOG family
MKPLRVLVCGGRAFADKELLDRVLTAILSEFYWDDEPQAPAMEIIEGGSTGADTLARQWALKHNVPVTSFPADWRQHGAAAGPVRNEQMMNEAQPDIVIAFPGGPGTRDMVRRAIQERE